MIADSLYLDHAATTPLLPEAQAEMARGFALWANPSSPHRAGRAAKAALEDARARIARALDWPGEVIFTSGASEALAIACSCCRLPLVAASAVEHEAVLRHAEAATRLGVDTIGRIDPADSRLTGLIAVQQVNSETGVIQPLEAITAAAHGAGGLLLADCAQSAGKIALADADLIAISAHKFGGPIGIGALLVRDFTMIVPSGGQERGYRGGTENLPGALGMAAALEVGSGWVDRATTLRQGLDAEILASGGAIIAAEAARLPTIAAYRMPGVTAAVQLIRLDALGIAVSAGSACSSGSLRPSHVLAAMGLGATDASQVIRVSIGRETTSAQIDRFLAAWREIAAARQVAA